jgi:eukaryotic-like serine/threonine-protein kinase
LKTPFRERWGTFSPDGRWVAYQSNESGRDEIYLRPFVPPGEEEPKTQVAMGNRQVSTAGGIYPLWSADGKELYYLDPAGAMMAVPITTTASQLLPGTPAVLFPTRIVGGGVDIQGGRQYDITSGGLFLINMTLDSAVTPITLIQNWNPEGAK